MSQGSRWNKFISKSGTLRVVTIEGVAIIEDIAQRHSLPSEMTQGLGEAVLTGLLLASSRKAGERINLSIQGSGLWKQAVVDAYPEGFARGFVSPGKPDWHNASRGPWENGLITVLSTKSSEGNRPYSGTVALETGYLDQDIAFYWNQSEQIPTTISMNMSSTKDGVVSARAIMVQAITGATAGDLRKIEHSLDALKKLIKEDVATIPAKLPETFEGEPFSLIEETPLQFKCNCSAERVEEALLLTGSDDLKYMLVDREHIEVKCDFCSNKFQLTRSKVEDMLRRMNRGNA